jgi:hypothetical protein
MPTDVAHVDLQWANVDPVHMLCRPDGTAAAVRISVMHDEPVFAEELQERVDEMTRVDVKQRRSFCYTPRGEEKPVWAIDATLVWRKPTYMDAVLSMKNREAPLYMVELRCIQPMEYLTRLGHAAYEHLALNCLLKVADLFDAGTSLSLARCGARLIPDRAIVKAAQGAVGRPGTSTAAAPADHYASSVSERE